jgi:tRNA(fMet)-specific endonuclease VapC
VWAVLGAAGTLIGPHDLWLAATCIAHGLTMVTADTRELARVPGLDIELWDDPC